MTNNLFAKNDTELISIVRVPSIPVSSKTDSANKYIVDHYPRGKVLKLDWCDKHNWCKVKDKELYLAKIMIGIMEVEKLEDNIKHVIKKLDQPTSTTADKTLQKPSCIKLKQIDLTENKIFNKEDQAKYFSKNMNQCIKGKLLKSIIHTTSTYYLDKGYITTKPYLLEQTINDGQLDIHILEGTVENIIHSDTNGTSWKIATAFAGQKNGPLNLRELETSLEVMNRVESGNSNFELRPGDQNGASVIVIKTEKTLPIHLTLGVSGRDAIKDDNPDLTAIISIDNLLNINDILAYTYNGSQIQQEYQGTEGSELHYSFPIASYLIELISSSSSYRQGVDGINDLYLSNGKTKGLKLIVGKVLSRNQTNKFETKLSIYHKDTKNYFENQLIEVSSYKTSLFQADFIHTNYQAWGQLYTQYSIYRGTDWFNALSDLELNGEIDYSDSAKLEFTKYSINSTLYYYLKDRSYNVSSNFHLQYTEDLLYNNDQLRVGSDYTVRGYFSSNYYGNNAYYFKNDFTKKFSPNLHKDLLQDISLFIGLDGGNVKCESDNPQACGEIYGKSIGFSTSSNKLNSNFTWSRPITSLGDTFKKETIFSFNTTLKF